MSPQSDWLSSKIQRMTTTGMAVGKGDHFYNTSGSVNWYIHFRYQSRVSSKKNRSIHMVEDYHISYTTQKNVSYYRDICMSIHVYLQLYSQ